MIARSKIAAVSNVAAVSIVEPEITAGHVIRGKPLNSGSSRLPHLTESSTVSTESAVVLIVAEGATLTTGSDMAAVSTVESEITAAHVTRGKL